MMSCIKVEGRGNISATIIADSISAYNGKRIVTFELEYPRFVHAEFMTHRLFSRNAASSRAIPVKRMIELIKERGATFVHWGKNQAGMQAFEELPEELEVTMIGDTIKLPRDHWWKAARDAAIGFATRYADANAHKQIVNRLLEPFQMMKVVCTSTEFDNFFYLRCHKDAQPEIQELARVMYEAFQESLPETLWEGEWHTPYVRHRRDSNNNLDYVVSSKELVEYSDREFYPISEEDPEEFDYILSVEEAKILSASCCAQVSYRRHDESLAKALEIYTRLVESKPCHASPVEHQASPMSEASPKIFFNGDGDVEGKGFLHDGVTHLDMEGNAWSGNFKGWIQARQLVQGHTCWKYNG